MDKSSNRNHGKSRSERHSNPTPVTGIITDVVKAEELIADFGRGMPALRRFTRKNWKQIAMISAGVSVLAVGAYFYFNQKNRAVSQITHH